MEVKEFSKRYAEYFSRCYTNRVNCLEGAYRAGKSVINIFSFAEYLDSCEDLIHLATGASAPSARLNIADCNGLGLRYIFEGRCKTGKHEGNECLKIKDKQGREKIVIFVGGGQSDSYKKIQGLSFGSWLSVELANLYISEDDKCFISMALSRLTQSKMQRVWWDLNPTYPKHKVYTKFLDVFEEKEKQGNFTGGYNYMVCSLFDNTSISEEQKSNYLTLFGDKSSVPYQRNVLGKRACAEGVIFYEFAANKDKFIIKDLRDFLRGKRVLSLSVGIDFGGNGSNTTFVASLIYNNFEGVVVVASDVLINQGKDNGVKEFRKKLRLFIEKLEKLRLGRLNYVFGDCADQVMIREARRELATLPYSRGARVGNCYKGKILDRINTKSMLLAKGSYYFYKDAVTSIESTESQVWDSREGHQDERLDNGSCDIDTADAEEYSWSSSLKQLIRR